MPLDPLAWLVPAALRGSAYAIQKIFSKLLGEQFKPLIATPSDQFQYNFTLTQRILSETYL